MGRVRQSGMWVDISIFSGEIISGVETVMSDKMLIDETFSDLKSI